MRSPILTHSHLLQKHSVCISQAMTPAECAVCFEPYSSSDSDRRPLLLPTCGHSYCTACCRMILAGNRRCCVCRVAVPHGIAVDSLPPNYALLAHLSTHDSPRGDAAGLGSRNAADRDRVASSSAAAAVSSTDQLQGKGILTTAWKMGAGAVSTVRGAVGEVLCKFCRGRGR